MYMGPSLKCFLLCVTVKSEKSPHPVPYTLWESTRVLNNYDYFVQSLSMEAGQLAVVWELQINF